MGYRDITAGDKIGKAVAARLVQSPEKKTPGIEVAFEFEEPSTGNRESLNWIGWLSEKAMENTMDTLVNVLDSNGVETTNAAGVFIDPCFLNKEKEVRLVVDLEKYTNEKNEEKYYPKIQWVNNLGGSKFAACTPEVVKSTLAQVGFKAAFLAAKQASGQSAPQQQSTPPPNYAPGAGQNKFPF